MNVLPDQTTGWVLRRPSEPAAVIVHMEYWAGTCPVFRLSINLLDKLCRINKSVQTSFWHQRRVEDAVDATQDNSWLSAGMRAASEWVESIHDARLDHYIEETARRLRAVAVALNKLEGK